MNWKASSLGVISAAAVLLLLVAARLLVARVEVTDLDLREVEIATEPEPPPPPPPEPEQPPLEPPPPALSQVEAVSDPLRVPVPKAEVPVDVTLPVDAFFTELAPAPLPVVERPKSRPTARPTAPRPVAPRPAAKSRYSMSELDGRPRLLRHPSVAFPRELAARGVRKGTVVLEVELSESGSVSVRRVVSSSHSELVSAARKVAAGSRFTSPKRNGQAVKAIMRWPITIQQ